MAAYHKISCLSGIILHQYVAFLLLLYQSLTANIIVSNMNSIPHHYNIAIEPDDIDFMGHVNNANYLTWVQDAVVAHWEKIAPSEAVATHLWVALKHEITYRKPAFLDDDVIAEVLLEKVHGARAFYSTVIRRGEDVLAEVQSSWCCIDADTLRPMRIAKDIAANFFGPKE